MARKQICDYLGCENEILLDQYYDFVDENELPWYEVTRKAVTKIVNEETLEEEIEEERLRLEFCSLECLVDEMTSRFKRSRE